MTRLFCLIGWHKWTFESKNIVRHKTEANYDSAFAYFQYGSSNFYHYECDKCGKKQWVAERICTGIGIAFDPIYRKKIPGDDFPYNRSK